MPLNTMSSTQQTFKILGNIALVVITLPAVMFCGFYTGWFGAELAGMPHSDWALAPLLHAAVGSITALVIYVFSILLLQLSKSLPLAIAIVFGTILSLLVSPFAGAISYKISQSL
jgi:hypothetical protein